MNAYDSYQDDRKSVHVVTEERGRRMGFKERDESPHQATMTGWQFARIKAKCAVSLRALLEGNKNNAAVELVMKSLSK